MTIEKIKEATERSRQAAIHAILSHAGAAGRKQYDETNQALQRKLKTVYQQSFTLLPIAGDGDCFFRALADQLVTRYPEKTLQIYEDLNLDPAKTDFAMVLKKLALGGLHKIGEKDRAKTLSQQSVQAQSKDMTVLAVLLGIDIVPVSLDEMPDVHQVILSQSNEANRPTVFLALSDGHYSSLRLQANIKIPKSIQEAIVGSLSTRDDLGEFYYTGSLDMKDPTSLTTEGSMRSVYSSGALQSAPSHSGGGAKVESSQAYAVSAAVAAQAPELTWEERKKAEQEATNKLLIDKLSSDDRKFYDKTASKIDEIKAQKLIDIKDQVQLGYLEGALQEWLEAKSAKVKNIKIDTINKALRHFQSKPGIAAPGNGGGGAKMGSSSQNLNEREIKEIYEHFFPKPTLDPALSTAPAGETPEAEQVRKLALRGAKTQLAFADKRQKRFLNSDQEDNSPDAVFNAIHTQNQKISREAFDVALTAIRNPEPSAPVSAAAAAVRSEQPSAAPASSQGGGGGGAAAAAKSASRTPAGFFAFPRGSDSTITKQEFLDKFYNIILLVETLVDKKLITFEVYECLTNVFNQVGPSDQFDLTVISKVQKIINEEVCRLSLMPQLTPQNCEIVKAISREVDNLGNPPERHASPQPR